MRTVSFALLSALLFLLIFAPAQGQRDLSGAAEIAIQLERLNVRSVVIGPMRVGRSESIRLFRRVLDAPPVETGGVQLWSNVLVAARRGSGSCA